MAQMPLAEHDNVVKTFPPDRTDRPFHNIRSATAIAARLADPECSSPEGATDEDVTVDGVAVTNDVSRCCVPTINSAYVRELTYKSLW